MSVRENIEGRRPLFCYSRLGFGERFRIMTASPRSSAPSFEELRSAFSHGVFRNFKNDFGKILKSSVYGISSLRGAQAHVSIAQQPPGILGLSGSAWSPKKRRIL